MDDPRARGRPEWPSPGWPAARRPARPGCGRAGQPVGEDRSLEQLQRDERQAVHLADVVNLDDVGVAELGDGLGLDPEAGEVVGAGLAAAPDHLDGDQAVQAHLPGLVDDAHPPSTELLQELVAGDRWAARTGSACPSDLFARRADQPFWVVVRSGSGRLRHRPSHRDPSRGQAPGLSAEPERPPRGRSFRQDRPRETCRRERRRGRRFPRWPGRFAAQFSPCAGGQSLKQVLARPTRLDVGHDLRPAIRVELFVQEPAEFLKGGTDTRLHDCVPRAHRSQAWLPTCFDLSRIQIRLAKHYTHFPGFPRNCRFFLIELGIDRRSSGTRG